MSNHDNSGKSFLLGAVVGGIVGAVTALLLAPKSGKEIRSDINEQASALKDRSLQLKDTAVERGSEWISVAKEKSSDFAKTMNEQSQQVVTKVKDLTEKIKGKRAEGTEEALGNEEAVGGEEVSTSSDE